MPQRCQKRIAALLAPFKSRFLMDELLYKHNFAVGSSTCWRWQNGQTLPHPEILSAIATIVNRPLAEVSEAYALDAQEMNT